MSSDLISVALILATVLLAVGFAASVRGHKTLCAWAVAVGLVLAGLIIYAGFAGSFGESSEEVFGLSATVTAKLAIGIAMLLFAVAWVTVFSKRRDAASSFGLKRVRRPSKPTRAITPRTVSRLTTSPAIRPATPTAQPRTGRHQRPPTTRP